MTSFHCEDGTPTGPAPTSTQWKPCASPCYASVLPAAMQSPYEP
jgi:hypothetical protein